MKKLILFLLLPLWVMAQTSNGHEQEFDYGIKNNSTQTITTPPYLTTTGMDGTQGKIPSALVEKTDNKQNSLAVDGTGTKYPTVDAVNAALPKTYTTTVYVNANDPNTATIFDDENPPTVNDDGLKSNTDNLYIGLDASAWVYNGSTYVTKIVPASSNFYINSTSIDAGNSKDVDINRIGSISTSRYIAAGSGIVSRLGSSNIENLGSYLRLANKAGSENNQFQLNASNGVDLWNYSSGVWNKRFTFSSDGYLGINNDAPLRGLHIKSNTATGGLLVEHSSAFSGNIIEAKSNLNGTSFRVDYGGAIYGGNGINIIGNSSFQRVGVGDTPAFAYITGNGNNGLLSYGAGGFDFKTISNNDALHIKQFGNVLINTNTDTGENLQVEGSTKTTALTLSTTPTTSSGAYDFVTRNTTTGVVEKVSSNTIATTASPTFTGTPTAPTAPVGTNTTQIATTAFVANSANIIPAISATLSEPLLIQADISRNIIFGGTDYPSVAGRNKVNVHGGVTATGNYRTNDGNSFDWFTASILHNSGGSIKFINYSDGGGSEGHYNFSPLYPMGGDPNLGSGVVTRGITWNSLYQANSGNTSSRIINIEPIINQTGTASGIIRAIYVNPTLTSAADFRAIEVVAGKVIVPVTVETAVQEYADNAAALSAGLAIGTHYRTGDLLKIVH